MYLGGHVVALDCRKSYTQNKETSKKTRIGYEDGQHVMRLWLPAKEEQAKGEAERVLKGNRFAILATKSERSFHQAGVSAVSPQEGDRQASTMEEEFRRGFGERARRKL